MEERPLTPGEQPAFLDLHRADAYGRSFEDVYDRWYGSVTDAEATAAFVARRARGRPVLELGAGSGRLARPMAALGLTVVGLDGSAAMLRRCRPAAGAGLHLVQADMRAIPLTGPFGVALVAFNTLFNLSSGGEQLGLLVDLRRLVGDGSVIVEALDLSSLLAGPDQSIGVRERGPDHVVVTSTQLDPRRQVVVGQHLEISAAGVTVRPWRIRWLTPDQLDDLAVRAGLTLTERYGSWRGDPATTTSETHISVYRPE